MMKVWEPVLCSVALAASLVVAVASDARAQTVVPLSSSQRDCQTIVQCRVRRGGDYRGCISAYRCRRCRVVRSRQCGGRNAQRPVCPRVVCSWG